MDFPIMLRDKALPYIIQLVKNAREIARQRGRKMHHWARHWIALVKILYNGTVMPLGHPTFVLYFVVAILGLGALGIWLEVLPSLISGDFSLINKQALQAAFIASVPAFLAATTMQMVLSEKTPKYLRAFAILMLAFAIALLGIASIATPDNCISAVLGFIATAISMWMWWLGNANQLDLLETDPVETANATVGGDVDNALQGDLSGWKA